MFLHFVTDYKSLGGILDDPEEVSNYLQTEIGLSPEVVQAILNSRPNPSEVREIKDPMTQYN